MHESGYSSSVTNAPRWASAGCQAHGPSSADAPMPNRGLFLCTVKRFTDTQIWNKPWFRKLPPRVKELFRYLYENCEADGVIDPDWEMMSFSIGEPVTLKDIELLNGNVVELNGKLFLPQFIEFQYGKLSKDCPPHTRVFEALKRHRITLGNRVRSTLGTRALEKEEEEEEYGKEGSLRGDSKPTEVDIVAYVKEHGLTETDGSYLFHHWEGNGWTINGKPIKRWKSVVGSWKHAGYFPSQKGNGSGNGNGKHPVSKEQMLLDAQ